MQQIQILFAGQSEILSIFLFMSSLSNTHWLISMTAIDTLIGWFKADSWLRLLILSPLISSTSLIRGSNGL